MRMCSDDEIESAMAVPVVFGGGGGGGGGDERQREFTGANRRYSVVVASENDRRWQYRCSSKGEKEIKESCERISKDDVQTGPRVAEWRERNRSDDVHH
ncbi:hypothetical protein U1Q18_010081 [Sarracenia purpurea var. burkii]